MAIAVHRRFLSKALSENDNSNTTTGCHWDTDSCICYHFGCLFFSYPYGLTLYVATMEESVGILRLHGRGVDKEMCNGRNCSYGTVNFNGGGRFAICTIQIQCGKLVDFD